MAVKYGQSITWTSFGGIKTTITVDNGDTWEAVRDEAIRFAKEAGWTPPRWWQFWRWSDTRIAERVVEIESTPAALERLGD